MALLRYGCGWCNRAKFALISLDIILQGYGYGLGVLGIGNDPALYQDFSIRQAETKVQDKFLVRVNNYGLIHISPTLFIFADFHGD